MAGLRAYKHSYWGGGPADWHLPLFRAVADWANARQGAPLQVLYPGSHRHLTAAVAFDSVLFVDCDKRVAETFASAESRSFVEELRGAPGNWRFECANYEGPIPGAEDAGHDVLLSLSAGIVSTPCTRYVRPGGFLLASDAHSDARTAFLMKEWRLVAVWDAGEKALRCEQRVLDRCFRVKATGEHLSRAQVEESQRVGSKSKRSFKLDFEPMFYLFQRTSKLSNGAASRSSRPLEEAPPLRRSNRLRAQHR